MMKRIGRSSIAIFEELGSLATFFGRTIGLLFTKGVNVSTMLHQMYRAGVRSLGTTCIAGLFVGAIMAIQIHLQLVDFGGQGFLGGLSTSVTLRNVGPVLIGFILSGKVGAYTSAELGTMRVTDQIDALRCLGIDPLEFLVLPRLIAVVLSSFLLLVVGLMITIAGGLVMSMLKFGMSAEAFLQNIPTIVNGTSISMGIVKSLVFGLIIGVISCYLGYTADSGATGVGRTVRSTAVQTLLAIIIADFSITQLYKGL